MVSVLAQTGAIVNPDPLNQVSGARRRGAVIVPAYNEAAVIERTLSPLSRGAAEGFFELIVVCNGCTDGTADVARSIPGVQVLELDQGSKPAALNAGDTAATLWPRLYLDADIQISPASVLAVLDRLAQGDVLAARPDCRYDVDGASTVVRCYYRTRQRLPQHKLAMWGAGAYGLSAAGHERFGFFPMVTGDDFFIDNQFAAHEKVVVPTEPSVVRTPADAKSLLAILRRSHKGNVELSAPARDGSPARAHSTGANTAVAVMRAVGGPRSAVDAAVYLGMALAKRLTAGQARSWERDESSRVAGGTARDGRLHASGLSVECLGCPDDLDRIRAEWDALVELTGSDIYFTVDWLQAWWHHYGRGRTFHGLVFREHGNLVGALPFGVHRVWAGPVPVRLARFVGADSTLPVFTPAITKGYEESVLQAAFELLFEDARCDAVSLSPLSGLSPAVAAAERAADGQKFRTLRSDSHGPHAVFNLPENFELYLQSLSSAQRKAHRRNLRKLNIGSDISFRTISGDAAVEYFDRFETLHATYWRTKGKLGHFGDWPGSADFNRDLISRMAATGRARFYELAGDGRVLAAEYGFVLGDRCYSRLPARDADPELEKLGLGRVSVVEKFRVLIESGHRTVESGPGHYEHKVLLGAEEHALRRIVTTRRSGVSRWRSTLLIAWADLLDLVYYRAWFLKLRRKLRLPPRPLWRPWIQTRV
ncbi:GNAT family N-acetyltransferase [Mycolicibacterium diernhoferi]|uniref:GNAT family N-acetyltransferase n=1 Tax=Mycolicibacterium diernhoferi TaxID=1801 RepID=UPI000A7FA241|nr:GNAT family N-acetyltransferase [Mycolicibacterium diernhoferi]